MDASPINLRTLLPLVPAEIYADYCREERNYAALLYRELLQTEGLRSFLLKLGVPVPEDLSKSEVYFEYAHARDLWARYGQSQSHAPQRNEVYRRAITTMVGAPAGLLEAFDSVKDFNGFFFAGGSARASKDHIRMPNQWDQSQFDNWARKYAAHLGMEPIAPEAIDFAYRVCRLKWAFNAKADIVILLPNNRAICVEIKVASKESSYSCGTGDSHRTLKQTELQEYVLEDLLGYQTTFVFLSTSGTTGSRVASESRNAIQLAWNGLMEVLRSGAAGGGELPFVKRMLDSAALQPKSRRIP